MCLYANRAIRWFELLEMCLVGCSACLPGGREHGLSMLQHAAEANCVQVFAA